MSDEEHLGALLNPLKGYEELADILDPVTGRMMSPIGKGMKIEEAARRAEHWWDTKARRMMPDYRATDEYLDRFGIKSGILNGWPWQHLNRGERIQVVKQWHTHVGIPLHCMGFNITQAKEFTDEIRKFNLASIFDPALSKA